jgi:hypothetical protein
MVFLIIFLRKWGFYEFFSTTRETSFKNLSLPISLPEIFGNYLNIYIYLGSLREIGRHKMKIILKIKNIEYFLYKMILKHVSGLRVSPH